MPDSLFTFIAQIVNFLIIVFILRALLFKKIVAAIDGRQEEIRARFKKVEQDEQEAKKRRSELEDKKTDFRERRKELIDNAKQEADKKRNELVDDARRELENKKRSWEEQLEKEQAMFLKELKETAAKELMQLIKKALADLSDESVEQKMADRLILTLKEDQTVFGDEKESSESFLIKSSFSVPEKTQDEFTSLLGSVEFTRDDSIHGLSLERGGRRLEWTIEGWLQSFGSTLEERLEELQEQSV